MQGKVYAIKEIQKTIINRGYLLKSIYNEINIQKNINFQNIVKLYDF